MARGYTSAKAARRKARKRKGAIQARKKKIFTYRGYTLEQLQAMPLSELAEIMPARIRRTIKRGFNVEQERFLQRLRSGKKAVVRTHRREIPILPEFVGKKIAVHNGREFVEITVEPEMIGHYLGEFALTRKAVKHSGPGVGATRSSKYMPLK
ncbi:MAG: 30S ribosomal protein S19 [Thermoplasmata archaeon]|nr:30S ribosomal protein S19 [Thermoplasmata archaeon]